MPGFPIFSRPNFVNSLPRGSSNGMKVCTLHNAMKNRYLPSLVLCVIAPLSFSLAGVAQAPATPQAAPEQSGTTLKIQARWVVLPVTVRDKHGALVTSLKASDFTLAEDGRPQ